MSALPVFASSVVPRLSPFESQFVATVLEHRGIGREPSFAEFTAALAVLRRYHDSCEVSPMEDDAWAPRVDFDSLSALRAKVFVMFEAVRPTPAQWQKAHAALFGPQVCETCG